MKRRLRVGLLWHAFGHHNLGVDALARGNARLIREAARAIGAEVSFVTLGSAADPALPRPGDVEAGPQLSIRQLFGRRSQFMAAAAGCDIVFDVGEGDSFTDLYGVRRFGYQLGSKLAVLATGTPLVLSPQTIGPFTWPHQRAVAAQVMRAAKAVFARDELSANYARGMGVKAQAFTDVAFALPFRRGSAGGRTRIALNVSGLLWNGAVRVRLDYRALMVELIEAFSGRSELEVHLVAHVNGRQGKDTDEPIAEELSRRFPRTVKAPAFADASEAKNYVSDMDFVVAARMHAAIAAFSAGVPVVPIAYSRKVNGLFDGLGYRHFVDAQVDDCGVAHARIMAAFEAREATRNEVAAGNALAWRRLSDYREELVLILTDAAARTEKSPSSHEPA